MNKFKLLEYCAKLKINNVNRLKKVPINKRNNKHLGF